MQELTVTIPDYEERVKENSLIDMRSNETENHKEYDSEVTNNVFWGLNFGNGPNFSAIKIDEAEAYTLHINEVAIIPRDIFNCVVAIHKGKATVDDLMFIYNKHFEAIKAAKAI